MAFENSKEIAAALVVTSLDYNPDAMKLTPEARREFVMARLRENLEDLQADVLEACERLCPIA